MIISYNSCLDDNSTYITLIDFNFNFFSHVCLTLDYTYRIYNITVLVFVSN